MCSTPLPALPPNFCHHFAFSISQCKHKGLCHATIIMIKFINITCCCHITVLRSFHGCNQVCCADVTRIPAKLEAFLVSKPVSLQPSWANGTLLNLLADGTVKTAFSLATSRNVGAVAWNGFHAKVSWPGPEYHGHKTSAFFSFSGMHQLTCLKPV